MSYSKKKVYRKKYNHKKRHTKYLKNSKHKHNKSRTKRNTKKYRKKYSHKKKKFNYKKNMKGGSTVLSSGNPIFGDGTELTYQSADTPTSNLNYQSYIPSPLMNLKWSVESNLKNSINEVLGKPSEYGPDPMNQPIGKIKNFINEQDLLTTNDMNQIRQNIINTYSSK